MKLANLTSIEDFRNLRVLHLPNSSSIYLSDLAKDSPDDRQSDDTYYWRNTPRWTDISANMSLLQSLPNSFEDGQLLLVQVFFEIILYVAC